MRVVEISARQRRCIVRIGGGLLCCLGRFVCESGAPPGVMLVTDDTVRALYGTAALASLGEAGCRTHVFSVPPGERSKSMENYMALLETMANHRLGRSCTVLALGGGVVGDLAGYAAATYLRGVRFLQAPTTLLAAVDASVGGKTGVNLKAGKNLAGAFWQPEGVLADTDVLSTLSADSLADGAAEVIKYAMLGPRDFLSHVTPDSLKADPESLIERCVRMKAELVRSDERDRNERRLLNFGHTFGHAIEKVSGYTIPHGHAVAMGMVMVTRAAEAQGYCEGRLEALLEALQAFALPAACPFSPDSLLPAVLSDKKINGNSVTLVVPKHTEGCRLLAVPCTELKAWIS